MVLGPCIADPKKVRLIAHLSGNMGDAFPYINAEMTHACYDHNGPSLTFMDGYHMITLYPRRVAVAKADDLVDGWRSLEAIRCRVNETYARRGSITPLSRRREKPPAIEIYKWLPKENCRRCGQKTCMAFALSLWNGSSTPFRCKPMFEDPYAHLTDGYREICARLGFNALEDFTEASEAMEGGGTSGPLKRLKDIA
jgi:ArsR family metal-binding transcriptional regulator